MYSFEGHFGHWGVPKKEMAAPALATDPESFGNGGMGFSSDYGQDLEDFIRPYQERAEERRVMLEQAARPLGALVAYQVEVG